MNAKNKDRAVLVLCIGLFAGIMCAAGIAGMENEQPEKTEELALTVVQTPDPKPTAAPTEKPAYIRPIPGETVRSYSMEPVYNEERMLWTAHEEVDIVAAEATGVQAIAAGTVSATLHERGMWTVYILQQDGITARYAGLQKEACSLHEGQKVQQGEKIGELAKGDILHLALRKEEKWVDPQMMIK